MIQLHELTGVIYTRKSTASDGKSTRDQERESRNWCATNKIHVEKVFCDEGISASRYGKKKRDAWGELKKHLRSGHILVAAEASRNTRDLEEFVQLRNLCAERKVPLAYAGRVLDLTSGDDRFVGGLDVLLAERESEQIRERVLRGIRGAAQDGTPYGKIPWGYRRVPRTAGERPQWELDPVEYPRVRECVNRVIAGESYRSVWQWVKSTGYAPANPSKFSRVIQSPALAGLRVHQGRVVGKGIWPAILTEEEHNKLVARRKAETVTPGPESRHLCSSLATCGKCNEPLRYKKMKNRKPIYCCQRGCVSRLAEMLDKRVEEAVLRRLKNINPNDYNSDNPEVAEAERRIREIKADLAEWEEKAIAGEVSAEVFAKVERDRKRKIAELRPRTVPQEHIKLLRPENWGRATMKEKRDHVRVLLNIRVPPLGTRTRALPSDVEITPR